MDDKKPMNYWQLAKELDRVGDAGIWVEYDVGIRFRVGSNESPRFIATRDAKFKQLRTKYKNRPIPEAVVEEAMREIYANAALLEWSGLPTSETNDAPLPVSPENGVVVLSRDDRISKFVIGIAGDRAQFIAAIEEEQTKNSSTATSGSSSGVAVESSSETPL